MSQLDFLRLMNLAYAMEIGSSRQSHLPDYEAAICARLKAFRESLKWGQREFAEHLGTTKIRLASYEYARAPIRYWLARKLRDAFQLSPVWLTTGQPPMTGYLALDPKIEAGIPGKALLSKVYLDHFVGSIEMDLSLDVKRAPTFEPKVHSISDRMEILMEDYLDVVAHLVAYYQQHRGGKSPTKPMPEYELQQLEKLERDLRDQVRRAIANRPAFMRALIASLGAAPEKPERTIGGAKVRETRSPNADLAQRESAPRNNQRFAFGQTELGHSVDDLERSVRRRRERARIVLTLEALQKMEKPPPSLFRTVSGHDELREVRIASLRLLGFYPSPDQLVFVSVFSIGGGKKTPPSEIENATQRLNVASAIPAMALEELHARFSRDANYQRAYEEMGARIALGLHCRALREEAQLGKEELARTLGLTTWFLSEFESGDQSDPKVAATIVGHFSEGLRSRGVDPTGCLSAFGSGAAPIPSPSPEQRSATVPTGRGQIAPTRFGRAVTVKEDASTGH